MPELPEVEVLVRHLRPLIQNKRVRAVHVFRPRVIRPTKAPQLEQTLHGAKFISLERRGKFLLFTLSKGRKTFPVLGHLGMTGRIYVQLGSQPLPKHTSILLDLGRERMVFEDTRYFGRFTLDTTSLSQLGVEPLGEEFTPEYLRAALKRSSQAVKIKLLDQTVVAGVGNIYASEALFRARVPPGLPARKLKPDQVQNLCRAIRAVLIEAIEFGSTVPLNHGPSSDSEKLFYFGRAAGSADYYEERLLVYDRQSQPCIRCKTPIKRITQGGRSTFFCPACQKAH